MASRLGLRSGIARRGKPLCKCNATTKVAEGNLGGFCVCAKKQPRRGLRAEAACVGTPDWVGTWGGSHPAEVLALGY